MTKVELLKYIQQAVDSLEPEDLEQWLPKQPQPDLYTLLQELVGLRGELRKVSQAALKTNNDVQTMLAQQKNMFADLQTNLAQFVTTPKSEDKDYADNSEYQDILKQIIEQDDVMQRVFTHFESLPVVGFLNLNEYRQKMSAWKQGYLMTQQKWQQFVKASGIYPTGKVGDKFDPAYHEAIAVKADATQPHAVILETEILGFVRGEKIIRRAKVVVNKLNE